MIRNVAVCLLLAVLSSGCSLPQISRNGSFTTPADLRVVVRTVRSDGQGGTRIVTCAEPSPDIAKLVSESTNHQVGGGVSLPVGLSAQAAYGYARGRAEGMAQLTDRLATIQILRDAMYRACEAYANGAIDQASYALVLAHSERLMMGLLMSELIAGRKPVPLTMMGAGSDAEAAVDLQVAAGQLNLLPLQQSLSDTLTSLGGAVGRTVDVTNLDEIALLPGLSATARKLLPKAKALRGQVLDTQNQVLQAAGLPNLAKLPGLGGGSPGGARVRSRSQVRPGASAAAVAASADAQVEIARINAMKEFAIAMQTHPGVHALDGMEVGCITLLTSKTYVAADHQPLRALCLQALTDIFETKKAAVKYTVLRNGGAR